MFLLVQRVVPVLPWREEAFCPLHGGADGAHRLYKGHQQYLQVKLTQTIKDTHTHAHSPACQSDYMNSIPSGHPICSEVMFPWKQISQGMMMMMMMMISKAGVFRRTHWEPMRR